VTSWELSCCWLLVQVKLAISYALAQPTILQQRSQRRHASCGHLNTSLLVPCAGQAGDQLRAGAVHQAVAARAARDADGGGD
jgi:hypothetical protein